MPSSTTKAKREVAAAAAKAVSNSASKSSSRRTTPSRSRPASKTTKKETPKRGTPSKRQASAVLEEATTTTMNNISTEAASSPFVSPSKRIRTPHSRRYDQSNRSVEDDENSDVQLGRATRLFSSNDGDKKKEEESFSAVCGTKEDDAAIFATPQKPKKERFCGTPSSIQCSPSVKNAYSIVRRCTGSLGGNGSGGAIYGELTTGSMQKVVDAMIQHCELGKDSIFIDVGAGLGKPNIHVAQYPGVAASYGIEHEHVRWQLSLHNLKHLFQAAEAEEEAESSSSDSGSDDEKNSTTPEDNTKINHKIFFHYGDITEARTLDPFTHVYMFDIGFPPTLFYDIADRFNASRCPYLICYHGPKLIAERYGFDVELLAQLPTSMHGSSEGHTAYFYKRASLAVAAGKKKKEKAEKCDPLFKKGLGLLRGSRSDLHAWVKEQMDSHFAGPRPQRQRRSTKLFLQES